MNMIEYRLNGRKAALEVARLYRHLDSARLCVLQGNGRLRDASPAEIAAYNGAATPDSEANLDLQTMTKKELEAYAIKRFGFDLDRRKSKANLIEEINELRSA